MKLLIVEDDKSVMEAIAAILKGRYLFDVATTVKQAFNTASVTSYDAIILDIGLPDGDGIELCRRLRESGVATPIIILTGRFDSAEDKVRGLDGGADEYLVKPFHEAELLARLRAVLRRGAKSVSNVLQADDLTVDLDRRSVHQAGKEVPLKRKEYDLLEYMMANPNRVLTRDMIYEHVWDSAANVFNNTVDVHVKYLRDKLNQSPASSQIKTVHGLGYKFESKGGR